MRGRKPSTIKRRVIEVSLPVALLARLDEELRDETGRILPQRSALIERILREYLDRQITVAKGLLKDFL